MRRVCGAAVVSSPATVVSRSAAADAGLSAVALTPSRLVRRDGDRKSTGGWRQSGGPPHRPLRPLRHSPKRKATSSAADLPITEPDRFAALNLQAWSSPADPVLGEQKASASSTRL